VLLGEHQRYLLSINPGEEFNGLALQSFHDCADRRYKEHISEKMGMVKLLSALLLLHGCFILPLSGATLSVLVIETGIRESRPVHEFSRLWETTLMDVFFDAGHIVSNAPIMQLNAKPKGEFPDAVQGAFKEAAAGGSNFFILALVDYQGMAEASPPLITLKVFSVSPYRCVVEQQYLKTPSRVPAEEVLELEKAARALLAHLSG
jgi:hypothetical protein